MFVFKTLNRLDLRKISYDGYRPNFRALNKMMKQMNLKSLDCSGVGLDSVIDLTESDMATMEAIPKYCPNLTKFIAKSISMVRRGSWEPFHENHPSQRDIAISFYQQMPGLIYLDLQNTNIADEVVETILIHCTNLQHLNISHNIRVKGKSFTQHLPSSLTSLNLENTSCEVNTVLEAGILRCPNLEILNVSMVSTASAAGWTDDKMISLKELHMTHTFRIYNDDIPEILARVPSLETLNMSSSTIKIGLHGLARDCPDLKSLDISLCDLVEGIVDFLSRLKGLNLTRLNCGKLRFRPQRYLMPRRLALESIINFRQLEVLDLSEWKLLTCDDVALLIIQLPTLRHLYLYNCPKVIEHDFHDLDHLLSKGGPELKERAHTLKIYCSLENQEHTSSQTQIYRLCYS